MVKFHSSVTFSPSIPLTFPGDFFIQWIAEKGKRVLVRGPSLFVSEDSKVHGASGTGALT